MLVPSIPIPEIVLRTIVVYIAVLGLLRIAGKRELGQMSVTDLVVILVIANAVQNALNGGDVTLTGGLVSAATLIALNVVLDRYGRRVAFFKRFVVEQPALLLRDGTLVAENVEREGVTREEIETAAREHGIADLAEVSAAVLEPDGSISIIPKRGPAMHRSRRTRQLRHRG